MVVVTVAKLIARKRVDDVIHAVASLGDKVHLWVLGDGGDREKLHNVGRELLGNRVRWFGFTNQSEIPGVVSCADVFVLASSSEPWGLVTNEAMACGLPVVISEACGCADDLVIPGETGWTFPVGNVRELEHRLSQMLKFGPKLFELGLKASNLVEKNYSSLATAKQMIHALANINCGSPYST
jgi:glycosyltransferase involved in cell wall biosynthesis